MDIMNFTTDLMNDATKQEQLHFRAPTLNLTVRCHQKDGLFYTEDMTTFENADTGEMIVTVPSNIKEISKWSDWDFYFRGGMEIISEHSPVYRVIKAIFDGKLFAAKDPEDEYDKDYEDYLPGYEIM